jgi:hypothetical protein
MQLGRSRKKGGTAMKWDTSAVGYADDVNLLRDKIDNIKKNTETLIGVSKEAGLEVNAKKTVYMLLFRHYTCNAEQNHDIKIANRYFENVAQFKCLRTTVTKQNLI